MFLRILIILFLIITTKIGAETKYHHQCSDFLNKEYLYKISDFQGIKNCLQKFYHQNDGKSVAEIILKIKPSIKEKSYEMGTLTAYEAWVYIYARNSVEAEKIIKKSQDIADNLENNHQRTALQLLILIFKSNILEIKGKNGSAIIANTKRIFDLSSKLSPKTYEYYYFRARASNTLSMYYSSEGNDEEADKYLKIAEENTKEINEPFMHIRLYKLYGLLAMKDKKHDQALDNYLKAVKIAKQNGIRSEVYNINPMISEVYQAKKDYKAASQYSREFKKMNDSLNNERLEIVEFLEKNNYDQNETEKKSFLKIIFILIPILILGIIYFRKNRKHIKIDYPERTVSSKDIKELTQLSKENEEAFYVKFPEIFPELYQKLNHLEPHLSSSEVKFCMYLKMKFSTKDIAIFTNSTPKSIENRKYRLRKKLNISADEDIYHAIDAL